MTQTGFPRVRRCVEGSRIWARRGQTNNVLKVQIRTNLREICVPSKSVGGDLWQLLNTTHYGLAPWWNLAFFMQFESTCKKLYFQILPSVGIYGKYTLTLAEGNEGMCETHVKGRRASSNYLGCCLRETKDAELAFTCCFNMWKTYVYQHIILCRVWANSMVYYIQFIS